jgi:hypothetical protein
MARPTARRALVAPAALGLALATPLLAMPPLATPALAGPDLALPAAAPAAARLDRALIAGEAARPCPQYGPGFVRNPGTGACTRVSGRVRVEAGTARRGPEREGPMTASGRLAIDTRTETDYGPARVFVRFGNRR